MDKSLILRLASNYSAATSQFNGYSLPDILLSGTDEELNKVFKKQVTSHSSSDEIDESSTNIVADSSLDVPTIISDATTNHTPQSDSSVTVPLNDTISKDNADDPSTALRKFVMSQQVMHTWGYPLPIATTSAITPVSTHETNSCNNPSSKKPRTDSQCSPPHSSSTVIQGCSVGLQFIPSLQEADCIRPLLHPLSVHHIIENYGKNNKDADTTENEATAPTEIVLDESLLSTTPEVCHDTQRQENIHTDYWQTMENSEASAAILWPHRPELGHDSEHPPSKITDVVALDCEMCATKHGLQLTRVSVVDLHLQTIFDTYVLPRDDITDYLTEYSGITAATLKHVTVTFDQARVAILRILNRDMVLVGHSLENDLKALKICHMNCVDTAVLFPHPSGFPYRNKLKYLSAKILKIQIQQHDKNKTNNSSRGDHQNKLSSSSSAAVKVHTESVTTTGGHDSSVDAATALQLALWKTSHTAPVEYKHSHKHGSGARSLRYSILARTESHMVSSRVFLNVSDSDSSDRRHRNGHTAAAGTNTIANTAAVEELSPLTESANKVHSDHHLDTVKTLDQVKRYYSTAIQSETQFIQQIQNLPTRRVLSSSRDLSSSSSSNDHQDATTIPGIHFCHTRLKHCASTPTVAAADHPINNKLSDGHVHHSSKDEIKTFLSQLSTHLRSLTHIRTLLVITGQSSLQTVESLSKTKKASSLVKASAVWSKEQENLLKSSFNDINLCPVSIHVL